MVSWMVFWMVGDFFNSSSSPLFGKVFSSNFNSWRLSRSQFYHGVLPITRCPVFDLSLFPQYYHNPGLNSALILPNIGGWVFSQSRNPWSSGGKREFSTGYDHIATSNSAFAGVHLSCWLTILLKRFRLFFRGKKKLGTLHQCPCILLLFKLSEYTEG